jgi:hypothetical protein
MEISECPRGRDAISGGVRVFMLLHLANRCRWLFTRIVARILGICMDHCLVSIVSSNTFADVFMPLASPHTRNVARSFMDHHTTSVTRAQRRICQLHVARTGWHVGDVRMDLLGIVDVADRDNGSSAAECPHNTDAGSHAIALAVRLGATLPLSVGRARKLTVGGFIISAFLFGTMSAILHQFRGAIFGLFTNEEAVLDGAQEIWPKVCIYFFNLCIYALNMGVATGLGQQWFFGIVTIIFLWGLSLPSMYYLCVIRGGGLNTAWACITQPYIVMNAFLIFRFFFQQDWKAIQHVIRIREGMENRTSSEAANGDHAGLLVNIDSSVKLSHDDIVDERTELLMVQKS